MIAAYGNTPSDASGKIHGNAEKSVTEFPVNSFIRFLHPLPEGFLLLKSLFRLA